MNMGSFGCVQLCCYTFRAYWDVVSKLPVALISVFWKLPSAGKLEKQLMLLMWESQELLAGIIGVFCCTHFVVIFFGCGVLLPLLIGPHWAWTVIFHNKLFVYKWLLFHSKPKSW